ncbi:MAG TPA: endonuclease/exonuclease/phosphatase family protein [Alphaproteobacteria bacterium]|nr:endonuclease/exonuclease/phosphatase family protein [Alphaproteobacteria bacterium]
MGRLRIATFNLENLGEEAGGSGLKERITILRPQLQRLDADILCLQEVNAQEIPGLHRRALTALNQLLEHTHYAAYSRIATAGQGDSCFVDRHNQVILSRQPIVASREIWHEFVPPLRYSPVTAADDAAVIEARFDRPILYAAIELPNSRTLHLLNLHLKAPLAVPIPGQKRPVSGWSSVAGWSEGFFLASIKRASQALEARVFLDRLFDKEPDALVAVCGDFNADSREVPVRLILGTDEDTGTAGLLPSLMTALEHNVPVEQRYSVTHGGQRIMLDHLLVSPALLALHGRTEIHNEQLVDEVLGSSRDSRSAGSFHAPVVAEFTLPS